MITLPCKITLLGDKERARDFIGAAQSQMRILENQMSFQNLKQGARRVRLNPRVTISALACFSLREVIIECIPRKVKKAEKRKLKLIPRFFAYIVKVDPITEVQTREYKWIYFNNKEDSVDLNELERHWSRFDLNDTYEFLIRKTTNSHLEMMRNTPIGVPETSIYKHPHKHTKAFMMDGRTTEEREADKDEEGNIIERPERWVAAAHMLTKNRNIMFMPLHAYVAEDGTQHPTVPGDYFCDILDTSKWPMYPLPFPDSLWAEHNNILSTGLKFPVPPRHFYADVEKGIMAWYSTNIDCCCDMLDFIGGIVYDIRNEAFYDFLVYPDEANGKGYETCWALYYGHSELPQNLMSDIQSLDQDKVVIAMSWNKRPIQYTYDLKNDTIATAEITSCTRVRWTKEDTGFEHELLTEWTQFYEDPPAVYQEDSVPSIYIDDDYAPCGESGFLDGSEYKYDGGDITGFVDLSHRHSDQSWDLLGTEVKLLVDVRSQSVSEYCYNYVAFCEITGPLYDHGIVHRTYSKWRSVQEQLFQQESDDYRGCWVCNNALDFRYRKHRQYIDGEAWTHAYHSTTLGWRPGYFPQCSGCSCDSTPTEDDFNSRCTWDKNFPPSYIDASGFSFPCFYTMDGDEMRGDDWIAIDSDTISCKSDRWEWLRESNKDDYHYYDKDIFNIDGEIEFSYDDVDHVYYLDDRATEDNQGLIAAGKGDSITELYINDCTGVTEYKPDYWKIYWKIQWDEEDTEDMEYLDITEKLLEALGCENHELIDLGLI